MKKSNKDIVHAFEILLMKETKAANGWGAWSQKSEKDLKELRDLILDKMEMADEVSAKGYSRILIPKRTWCGIAYYEIPEAGNNYLAIVDSGWNGEKYDAWFADKNLKYISDVTARPIHRWEVEGIDICSLEENSDEWDKAMELIGFNLDTNL